MIYYIYLLSKLPRVTLKLEIERFIFGRLVLEDGQQTKVAKVKTANMVVQFLTSDICLFKA